MPRRLRDARQAATVPTGHPYLSQLPSCLPGQSADHELAERLAVSGGRCAVAVRADVPVVVGAGGSGLRACASVVFRAVRGPGGTADTRAGPGGGKGGVGETSAEPWGCGEGCPRGFPQTSRRLVWGGWPGVLAGGTSGGVRFLAGLACRRRPRLLDRTGVRCRGWRARGLAGMLALGVVSTSLVSARSAALGVTALRRYGGRPGAGLSTR
jgi:hypothetical protein